MMIIAFAIVLGIVLALNFNVYISPSVTPYVAITILASVDSLLGAYAASLSKKYNFAIFITGLIGNSLIAALLIFMGKKVGLDLYLAAVIVFVIRIFQNFAITRRFFLKFIVKNRDNEKNIEKNA